MQGKNFLFERSDLDRRTPMMLVKKLEFGRMELSNVSTNLLPQFNLFHKEQFDENMSGSLLVTTPPMEKKSVPTPRAPVKNKKQSKKVDLKPKKLQYTDEELDASSVVDSGIYITSDQASDTLYYKQHTVKCNRSDSTQRQIRKLRTRLDKIDVQANDKENDRNVLGNKSKGAVNTRNNLAPVTSVVLNLNEVLSQCDNNLDWKEKLRWLQARRDVGLWVECCRKKCKKLRYIEEYHDPLDVPKIWYCEMNSDKSMASCNIPEEPRSPAIESDLIENAYNAGSIVWAYIRGFKWWPGIVNDCPTTFTYYKLRKRSQRPVMYYVTFISEEKLECAWVPTRNIKPFEANKYSQMIKTTKFKGIDYKSSLDKAYELALSALPLSILQRLQKFSYIALYEKLYDSNNNLNEAVNNTAEVKVDTNSDDEIPLTSPEKEYVTLKGYYLRIVCKKQDTQ